MYNIVNTIGFCRYLGGERVLGWDFGGIEYFAGRNNSIGVSRGNEKGEVWSGRLH